MIQTDRLYLIPTTLPLLEAIADADWASLSAQLGGVDMAEHWMHFPDAMIWLRDFYREHQAPPQWWSYLIVHARDVRLIGTCGFKGEPEFDGSVEIGYEIADAYQNQGLATEAARALTHFAFQHEPVTAVKANTLAETNASNHLLQKLGFRHVGEFVDLEDGKVWEWKLSRADWKG